MLLVGASALWAQGRARADGSYRYGGYTPDRAHGGEWAEIEAPTCRVSLRERADHDAAYVDVSNGPATAWGQTGWWLGTSGSGVYFGRPEGYAEYRTLEGDYRWIPLGRPPAWGRYVVYRTPLTMRTDRGATRVLYRIETSFAAGAVATYPYPARTGFNEGLAESYSAPHVVEPIGPTHYRDVELLTGRANGSWHLWVPSVDGAERVQAPGDRVEVSRRWHAWSVEGHLYHGPSGRDVEAARAGGRPPLSRAAAARRAAVDGDAPTTLPRAARGRLFAPPALRSLLAGTAVLSIGVDARGRLFGAAARPDGSLLVFRWSVPEPGSTGAPPPERWVIPDRVAGFGVAGEAGVAGLDNGTDVLAGGLGAVVLPESAPPRPARLPGRAVLTGVAPGPTADTFVVSRAGDSALEIVRVTPNGEVRPVRQVSLGPVGQPGTLVRTAQGEYVAVQDDAHKVPQPGDRFEAGLLWITSLPLHGPARAPVLILHRPARFLATASFGVAVAGGDGASGVHVGLLQAHTRFRSVPALAHVGYWDDPVAASPNGTLWATEHDGPDGATMVLVAVRQGRPPERWVLPRLYASEGRGVGTLPVRGEMRLAAGRDFAVVTALDSDVLWVVYAP